ncbi:efflux RND transporter periplasmic adaptor subunit [Hufsiella ginkgonis]|uniref:Efflux RND transporter periplasmic adaptor subunit n=1 Tax=Hufsiella ginkgonis TaxID=2695274 RepID=A0A7K1XVL4_9SPHI|nr:efflux RND transporter periplasmic adaptor subunit [Hufsiella ginkgonis]MXV14556.1 efflux RND transporter periplasmic adaptor subunit [Hufsiella ginkgonis]
MNFNPFNLSYKLNAALFAGLLITGCSSSPKAPAEPEKKPESPGVETFRLEKQPMATALHLPGELLANQQVDIYAKISSFVKKLSVDIGSEVRKGQLLLTLEAPEMNSQLAGAESKLKSAEAILTASKANYNRLYETSKTPGTVSKNDLDQAMARRNSDEAQYEAARASIKELGSIRDYLEIRAPFDGVISARNVNPGAYVGPSGKGSEFPLFTLQEQKNLRLSISIPEAYTGYIHNGDAISFTVKSHPAEVYNARVTRMSGALDAKLRSEKIEMDVKNPGSLLPGMITEVNIPLPSRAATFVIPKKALLDTSEGLFVIRVTDGKVQKVAVKKGRETEEKIEVFGELAENDVLVKEASEEMRDGSPIRVKK